MSGWVKIVSKGRVIDPELYSGRGRPRNTAYLPKVAAALQEALQRGFIGEISGFNFEGEVLE